MLMEISAYAREVIEAGADDAGQLVDIVLEQYRYASWRHREGSLVCSCAGHKPTEGVAMSYALCMRSPACTCRNGHGVGAGLSAPRRLQWRQVLLCKLFTSSALFDCDAGLGLFPLYQSVSGQYARG